MGHVIVHIIKNFRLWERPSQIAFLMALILALPALILAVIGDAAIRGYAVASLMASLFVAQLIFLWASRGMVSDYTRAQRHFLRQEFAQAQQILLLHLQKHPKDVQAMTLLGNTYRQQGDLDNSHRILLEAINIQPMNYFPLYGFGRTLLVAGQFEQALQTFQRARQAGGHDITYFDIGESAYYLGDMTTAREALNMGLTRATGDDNRVWMARALLCMMDQSPLPPLTDASRAYWTAQAHLFAHTPYGEALHVLLAEQMQS
jgi:tetratricopeptide (TPR) repeat protein